MRDTEYLVTEELAARLRTTPQALLSARHRGAPLPPALKVGRRLLWPVEGCEKWLAEQLDLQKAD